MASGANNAVRELGGVLGIAILASVFASRGSYASGHAFVAGTRPAVAVGAVVVGIGAAVAAMVRRPRPHDADVEAGLEDLVLVS